jgi:O-antigen/teichoic acid export membrane protein
MSGYQPYPSTGKPVEPDRGEAPPSVLKAVKLMYAGAAVSTVSLIVSVILPLADIAGSKATLKKDHPSLTTAQVNQAFTLGIAIAIISGLLDGMWMARANGKGKNWARITSSVFFALATVSLFSVLNAPSVLGVIFAVALWVVGLGAIILLWRKESSDFFKPRQFG